MCALHRTQPFLAEFAHRESASGEEGHWPAASELTEQRPGFTIYSNGTKITSAGCVRGWDKWDKCVVRMGLIYAEPHNANLGDIAALLLSRKNDKKWDNDADLLPGRGTEFRRSCDHQISHRCFDPDTDSRLRSWMCGCAACARCGSVPAALQERDTHMAKINAIRVLLVNMSSACRAGGTLSKSSKWEASTSRNVGFELTLGHPWAGRQETRGLISGSRAVTVGRLHYTLQESNNARNTKLQKNTPKLPLFYCQLTQNIISNFLLLTQ